ncbi:polyketide cyclase/dehydrase/lipid transport protein [Jatrophihabitans sp. GAS493]|uniref:SRPBCC family protein n=1 Tax=Jatrophihabitans sp. GAS493 TaxID=1907575 RepID=UPI000BB9A680|nr:SRPBCC family protein [Jatrophihabitans sp. GAS493]SOD71877.1 polyketide cyclase/dehydrase/lipid transport protein [Jatrophihabitans sp. GAS493]
MDDLTFSASITVARSADDLYDLVADVTNMGDWSPICKACWWEEEPGGPAVGAFFRGRNVTPERTWETRSEVVAAERGREFAFEVTTSRVRWGYTFRALGDGPDAGTELTERWDFPGSAFAFFQERYGDQAQAQIEERTRAAHEGIPETLAAIKAAAEK